ncbi:MAG: DMT family transporter [Bdellovibrio sp.]
MIFKYLLPVIVGLSIVFQGTLNRTSTGYIGLASAVLLNAIIFLVFATAYWLIGRFNFLSTSDMASINFASNFQWWQMLPGFLGFLIVFCTPIAIGYFGANLTYAIIICTQLLASMLWDSVLQKTLPSTMSLFGVVIMGVGLGFLLVGKR